MKGPTTPGNSPPKDAKNTAGPEVAGKSGEPAPKDLPGDVKKPPTSAQEAGDAKTADNKDASLKDVAKLKEQLGDPDKSGQAEKELENVSQEANDPQVRQAIYQATDLQAIAATTYGSGYPVVQSVFDSTTPYFKSQSSKLGFNLALTKTRHARNPCADRTIFDMFDAYRQAHPDHGWVHQLLGAWVWDCEHDFDKGFALYKKSCSLGHQAACEQVEYTKSCMCQERRSGSD